MFFRIWRYDVLSVNWLFNLVFFIESVVKLVTDENIIDKFPAFYNKSRDLTVILVNFTKKLGYLDTSVKNYNEK